MNLLKTSLMALIIILMASCNSKKASADSDGDRNDGSNITENQISETAKEMMEAGFMQGIIVTSSVEGDCPVKIKLDDENYPYFLDPVNLDEQDSAYKVDGTKIWVTFQSLKMMSRCDDANPVNIMQIQKRED